jgi:hypothetical protein
VLTAVRCDVALQDQLFRGLEAALGTRFTSEPLAPPPEPMILVISGPSGVGKDAVIKVPQTPQPACNNAAFAFVSLRARL